jgi:Iron-containing redox enzyme
MAPLSHSDRIRVRLALVKATLSGAALRVLEHPRPERLYPQYLLTMYGISRAAVPLMEFAVREAGSLASTDPTRRPLIDYLRAHIPEERGHADWILEDLETAGFDRDLLVGHTPTPTIAALVGSQYYWIEHVHPIALLGYLAVMETNPPSADAVDRLAAATGFPPAAFRSMRAHARLDVRHEEDLYRALDDLPIEPSHERLIGTSALQTAALLTEALIQLVSTVDAGTGRPERMAVAQGATRR